jgi:hypothetical protein
MIPQKLTKLDRGISRGRMILLIGLALLIVVASVGLVSAVRCVLLLTNNGNSDLTWHWSSPFSSIGGYPPYLTIPAYGTISVQKTETIEIDVDGPPVYSCPTQIDIVLVGPVNTVKVVWSCS